MPHLTVAGDDVEVELLEGETILEGLYRNGYAYRIGCRRGGCAICKVDLLDGDVTYNRPVAANVLTDDERAAGTCLSCRAVPAGDVTVALRTEHLRRVSALMSLYALASAAAHAAPPAAPTVRT